MTTTTTRSVVRNNNKRFLRFSYCRFFQPQQKNAITTHRDEDGIYWCNNARVSVAREIRCAIISYTLLWLRLSKILFLHIILINRLTSVFPFHNNALLLLLLCWWNGCCAGWIDGLLCTVSFLDGVMRYIELVFHRWWIRNRATSITTVLKWLGFWKSNVCKVTWSSLSCCNLPHNITYGF